MQDLEQLLAPISDEAPSGADLSFSVDYDAIQEARRADDPSLEQGEWITDLKVADWQTVAARSTELLKTRSKDLRLASWWTESQTQIHGFAGLAQGYRLTAALCERFWDDIHPQAEDGDQEQRIGNLVWLLEHSTKWSRRLPLIQSAQERFSIADIELAHARRNAEHNPGPTVEQIDTARRATPREYYQKLVESVPDCREALRELERAVDARLAHEGPSFAQVRDQLDHLVETTRRFAREAGVLVDGVAADPGAPGEIFDSVLAADDSAAPARPAPSAPGVIDSRREAIAQLRRVAEFFRRTEPHSPVAYLADKAARWGEMPLHVWLKRVIKDESTLSQIEELLDSNDNPND
ncbi:type VI secretion system protein ImpA [Lysobacter sp. yr284]|uniref:type VI secretion system protein TssA n=1 Tax=Lysobacter sp. yr284 TaxID=1761791 RepID=UPI000896FA54|nr:type VI secretion system protein TssA [Lysobacter sp. yr284]SDY78402.1 type VI secretion system protein ImpA [Lysobacter sp. yr284]